MLDAAYLDKIAAYFASGDLAFDFEHGDEARRQQILEYLERLMDLADEADALATKLIFKGGYLEALSGAGTPSEPAPASGESDQK
jgi:hypothetical protein